MSALKAAPVIEALSVQAGYAGKQVLFDVSLALQPREVLCMIGHNGAGKSTLMRTLFGLIKPQGGTLKVDGQSLTQHTPRALADDRHGLAGVFEVVGPQRAAGRVGVQHRAFALDRVEDDRLLAADVAARARAHLHRHGRAAERRAVQDPRSPRVVQRTLEGVAAVARLPEHTKDKMFQTGTVSLGIRAKN